MPLVTELPLPVSVLLRRAHNAKSPKDRHDTAYFAWEVSARLAVAARLPEDLTPLAHGSVHSWVDALVLSESALDAPPLLAAHGLFSEVGQDERASPKSITAKTLLDGLPGYRDRIIGQASAREASFYGEAAKALVEGLRAAWAEHVFLPKGSRLVYVESVALDPDGLKSARLFGLTGNASRIVDPRGTVGVPEDMLPHRLYLEAGERYRLLHPWVLFRQEHLRECVFFFNGLEQGAEVLDYASGDTLRGRPLEEAFPGAVAALFEDLQQQPASEEQPAEEDPDHFGGYRLLGKLGEGGMGEVYLAEQESLGRLVALKMLPAELTEDPVALSRFRREVAALSRCDHPNVVKILASGEARGVPYYAMEYVEGSDLSRVARVLGASPDFESAVSTASEQLRETHGDLFAHLPLIPRPPPQEAARQPRDRYRQLAVALRDAARGVEHLHQAGIVHRDLKPGNLMVTVPDNRVVVMDLGLAMVSDATRSITRDKSHILGTLRYMPPEQLQRNLLQIDRRADVYSLGASFYELLTEKPFFDGDTEVRLIEQVLREEPVPPEKANPKIPSDLATILRKATEKDPGLRYDTAQALAADVDAFHDGRPIAARPPTLWYLLKLAMRRNRAVATTLAAACLVVMVGTALFLLWLDSARRRAEDARQAEVLARREVLRLSDVKTVRDLREEVARLWPLDPAIAPSMAAWLKRAQALLATQSDHRARLEQLRASALPYTEDDRRRERAADLAGIEAAKVDLRKVRERRATLVGREGFLPGIRRATLAAEAERLQGHIAQLKGTLEKRHTWAFDDPALGWQHEILLGLLAELDGLGGSGPDGGLVAVVERRHALATTLKKRSIDDQAPRWKETIAAIAASPKYGALRIEPQLGLIPLGPAPDSGLLEFAHLGSGSLPARDPKTQHLVLREDAALVLVLIPGGTFWMGAQKEDPDRPNHDPWATPDSGPVHQVTLSAFFLSKYECTQRQWERMTEGLAPSLHHAGKVIGGNRLTGRNPVEQVSWLECTRWLTRNRLVLPTEAQWEYACRAGTQTPWWSGKEVARLSKVANICDAYARSIWRRDTWTYSLEVNDGFFVHAPVGSLTANPYGLFDVHGNLWEWCQDGVAPYGPAAQTDPVREDAAFHVCRGGSWTFPARYARSAERGNRHAEYSNAILGVRPARLLISK